MIKQSIDETQGDTSLLSILLHFLPGVIATAVFVLIAPLASKMGYPSITALYLPDLISATQ